MEKNNKKLSTNEISLLVLVLISVILILVDLAVNLIDEINLQSQSDASFILLPIAAHLFNLAADQ